MSVPLRPAPPRTPRLDAAAMHAMPDYPHLPSTLVLAVHWLVVIALSLRVIARRLPIGVSLAWLAVVCSVPFAGAALYLFFGGKRLDRGRLERQKAVEELAQRARRRSGASAAAGSPAAGSTGESLYRQALGLLDAPALGGNRMRLITGYAAVFDALVGDIDGARESCRLAFYIWHEGGRADEVAAALLRARSRGVRCRLLLDAMGAKTFLRSRCARALREAGVEVAAALPRSFRRRADLRNHRKIVVVDGRVAYTGSQNLVDPRFFKQGSGFGQWVDAVVRIEGPAVPLLASIFEQDWTVETGAELELAEVPAEVPDTVPRCSPTDALMQVVPSGPAPHPDAIRQLLLTAIYSARQTLTLTTPYFVPDEAVLTALLSAADRGVDVTVIVPEKNDSLLVRYASVASFSDLLRAGARIALFQDGLLHTKSMVVDRSLTLFGSVNLDMRSFWLNFEISLFIYGEAFAAETAALQRAYLARAVFVDAGTWRARPARRRFAENAARLVGPLL